MVSQLKIQHQFLILLPNQFLLKILKYWISRTYKGDHICPELKSTKRRVPEITHQSPSLSFLLDFGASTNQQPLRWSFCPSLWVRRAQVKGLTDRTSTSAAWKKKFHPEEWHGSVSKTLISTEFKNNRWICTIKDIYSSIYMSNHSFSPAHTAFLSAAHLKRSPLIGDMWHLGMSTEAGIGLDSSWIIRARAQKVWK